MSYTPTTKFPILLRAFQMARPDALNPRLAAPIDADDTTILLTCEPLDYDDVTPLTGNFLFGIQAVGYVETCYAPAGSVSGTTITGAVRGVRLAGIDYTTGDADLAVAHGQDSFVYCNVSAIYYELIKAVFAGTIPTGANALRVGDLTAADVKVYANNDQADKPFVYYDESAQRFRIHQGSDGPSAGLELEFPILKGTTAELAALPELPAGGMVAYDTTLGQTVFREGSAWVANAAGGTVPDASPTVAGKTQEASQATNDAGTHDGSTGAPNFAPPNVMAKTIQDSKWVYAADSVGTDLYAITVTPAIAAYAAGQRFIFKVGTANTGACSLNVNAKGAVAIKTPAGNDTITGDILLGQIVEVVYDGTNFQMVSPSAISSPDKVSGLITASIDPAAATGNTDTVITTKTTPKIIELDINITDGGTGAGHPAAVGRNVYQASTLKYQYLFEPSDSSTTMTAKSYTWSATDNVDLTFGSAGNTQRITMSLQSFGATGVTVRVTNTKAGSGGGTTAIVASIGYTVIC